LKGDLGIVTGNKYAISLSVFFIGYIIVEVPSNLVLKAVKPHRWIPIIMVAWGITMTLMGLVENARGLEAARFFLGIAEGGLFPGINFLLTCWYARRQQSFRIGIFFSGATLAGAFGGVLAYGLKYIPFPAWEHFGDLPHQKNVPTPGGWRWIFILEGLVTLFAAIPGWWLLVDFPADDNKILTKSETKKWNHFLAKSQGVTNADVPFSWDQVKTAFADYRTYMYAVMYISIAEPLYSLALFTPTIIADLKFTGASANLMSTPPYVFGFITTMTTVFVADRYFIRGPFILFWSLFTIAGYAILISDVAPGVKYFGIFLTVAGVSPNIALAISWVGANFGPIYVRATVSSCPFPRSLHHIRPVADFSLLLGDGLLLHNRQLRRPHLL
jgi:MFS family permease